MFPLYIHNASNRQSARAASPVLPANLIGICVRSGGEATTQIPIGTIAGGST